jgi:hypothetical protein
MREQKQKIKRENDTKSPKFEEQPQMEGDIYENLMNNNGSPKNLQ